MHVIKTIKKIQRKIQLSMLGKASPEGLMRLGENKLLQLFKNAPNASQALSVLLKNKRIDTKRITNIQDFMALDFTMSKENTFNQFSLEDLCRPGVLDNLKGVLTSSGHSGNFAYGLTTWKQGKATPDLLDLALEAVFQIDEKKTLLINCLPMGVRFPSNSVTLADVSVREDMALSLIKKFSPFYDQIIIVCDPLFLKLLMDSAASWQIDWAKIHKHLILGEETFGENYRNYVGKMLHINPDDPSTGLIGSSMGAGELGLNLCFETLESISLRRAINNNAALREKLFGCQNHYDPLPMLFAYNPLATYLEARHPDEKGYGELLVSILDKENPIPLFRYHTGDEARLLRSDEIKSAFHAEGLEPPELPKMPLICIRGRQKDRLPSGLHMGAVKDALYEDSLFADTISGAFRMDKASPEMLHIQLRRGRTKEDVTAQDICSRGKVLVAAKDVTLWDYDDFPYGQTIDYERKFTYLT